MFFRNKRKSNITVKQQFNTKYINIVCIGVSTPSPPPSKRPTPSICNLSKFPLFRQSPHLYRFFVNSPSLKVAFFSKPQKHYVFHP